MRTTCRGKPATIVGESPVFEEIEGTPGDDVIVGGDGRDLIRGRGGNDLICGGRDGDLLFGGPGRDRLFGSLKLDRLEGGEGQDILRGGSQVDFLLGEAGGDLLIGGPLWDWLDGGLGSDVLRGGDGYSDIADFSASPAGVAVDLGAHQAVTDDEVDILTSITVVYGSSFDDHIVGTSEDESLHGGPEVGTPCHCYGGPTKPADQSNDGDDILEGQGGDDVLVGIDGSDHLKGGPGEDTFPTPVLFGFADPLLHTIDGGDGDDWVVMSPRKGTSEEWPQGADVDLTAGTASSGKWQSLLVSIENASGTNFDDHLTGTDGSNTLRGLGNGSDGDLIEGGGGSDHLDADWIFGNEWRGSDEVYGGGGDDYILAADGPDWAYGEAGNDEIVGFDLPFEGNDGAKNFFGEEGNDVLTGSASDDSLLGGVGTDTFFGRGGEDTCDVEAGEQAQSCEFSPPP